MDIANHLATIDRLCAQEFPAEQSRSARRTAGPGYFLVELDTSQGVTADDFHAYWQGIAQRLDDRWGEQLPWGQLTVRERIGRGEAIPEPWATLALRTDALYVWQTGETGRWVALGVADRDEQDEIQLLATVTEIDPA
nr:hypothetical protein OG999_45275 [Streptomyces sp. NBC_00886]